MAYEPRMQLGLKMAQVQVMSPQMQQSLAMLQAPVLDLQAMINKELQENPVLEELTPDEQVEAEQESGVELIAGISHDSAFGPCVTAGLGGIFVEVLEEVARRLPPFGPDEAGRMLRGPRTARALDGLRGGPAANASAAAKVLSRVSEMAAELEGLISEMDINPLIASPGGACAVDVRIRKA